MLFIGKVLFFSPFLFSALLFIGAEAATGSEAEFEEAIRRSERMRVEAGSEFSYAKGYSSDRVRRVVREIRSSEQRDRVMRAYAGSIAEKRAALDILVSGDESRTDEMKGHFTRSLEFLKGVIEISPVAAETMMLQSTPEQFKDRFYGSLTPEQRAALDGVVREHREQFPNSGAVNGWAGRLRGSIGDWEGERESYERAAAAEPDNPEHYSALAKSLARPEVGDWEGAYRAGLKAVELGSRDPTLHATMKLIGQRQGGAGVSPKESPAESSAESSAGQAPGAYLGAQSELAAKIDRARQALALAEHSARLGDAPKALAAVERSLESYRENPRAHLLKAALLSRQNRFEEALGAIDSALRFSDFGASSGLLAAKAEILNRMGRYSEALEAAKEAIGRDPGSAKAHHQAAWAFAGLGRRELSLASMTRAAELDPGLRAVLSALTKVPEGGDLLALFGGGEVPREKAAPEPIQSVGPERWVWTIPAGAALLAFAGFLTLRSRSKKIVPPEEVPADAAAGSVLGRTHKIIRQIGFGGMGVVYEAQDLLLERRVAIKKMRDEIRMDPRERERFLKEARMVASLRHPNIVEIHQILEHGQDVYLVFEFVSGESVSDLIVKRGRLTPAEALAICKGVAAALDYAHSRGIIHRDLKPSNVMISEQGEVMVMDFGVARQAKDSMSRLSMTNTVVGTPPYMAPEQEQGIVRRESDVFALAVCLYEMLIGELPYEGVGAGMLMAKLNQSYAPASRRLASIPAAVDPVIARGLDPDPDRRWSTAGEFITELESSVMGTKKSS